MLSGRASPFETYQRLSSGCSLSTSTFLALTWVSITTKNHSVAAFVLAVAVVRGRQDGPANVKNIKVANKAICFIFMRSSMLSDFDIDLCSLPHTILV